MSTTAELGRARMGDYLSGPVGQHARKLTAAIIAAKQRALEIGQPTAQVERLEYQLREAASQELVALNRAAADRARTKLEAERAAYLRSEARNAEVIERRAAQLSRSYDAMTSKEILEAARRIIAGETAEPLALDLLSSHLKRIDAAEHQTLRDTAVTRGLYEPWRLTDEGRELDTAARMHAAAADQPGAVPILVDGKMALTTLQHLLDEGGAE